MASTPGEDAIIRCANRMGAQLNAEIARLKKENDWLADRLHDAVNTCYGGVTHDQIDARSYEQTGDSK